MKKIFALLLAAALLTCFAACGKTETPEPESTAAQSEINGAEVNTDIPLLIINSEPSVVTAKDGFDNAGVSALICGASETYSFKASSDDVSWKVFVLDEEFTDGARYLPQAETPALEGDGELEISEGQYIYILCSESAFTTDTPSDATLSINYAE